MVNLFLKLIEQLNGSVFILTVILMFAFFLTYKIGGVIKSFCGIESRNDKFEKNIDGIKDDLADIKAVNKIIYKHFTDTVKGQSPISLTEKGEKIADKTGLKEKIINHLEKIKSFINIDDLNNPYDIQTESLDKAQKCFENFFTEQEKSKIKLHAYKKGVYLMEIYPIIGVIIRDIILKEKNISINEIDKHNPGISE